MEIDEPEPPLIDFERLVDPKDLPGWLVTSPEDLDEILADRREHYEDFDIPKKNGGFRRVYKVASELKSLQRHIARSIQAAWNFEEYVQGYVSGRSSTTNAALHLNRKVVLRLDLHDFFSSVTRTQVVDAFVRLGTTTSVAQVLSDICTLDECLPQGASSSPCLANMAMEPCDVELNKLATRTGSGYSRYGDDMVFSGDNIPEVDRVAAILRKFNLVLNETKTKRQLRGRPQFVCGLSVSDSQRPRVPARIKRMLRTRLHFAELFGIVAHAARLGVNQKSERKMLFGMIAYVNAVEPALGKRLREQYNRALAKDNEPPAHGNAVSSP